MASLAATVSAHGRVISISAGGKDYDGFLNEYLYGDGPPADLIAWSAQNGDNGFVDPNNYTTSNIACHIDSAPGGGSAKVAAGSTVTVTWGTDTWPESHHGPVLDYLAKCAGDACTSASPSDLSFFKIGEAGLNDGSTAPGTWASDDLIAAGNKWDIKIPATLAPGQYVLRHEIIALHSAGSANGAQNYPQCFNLEVTGSGSASPSGVAATELYTPNDAGILADIYTAPIKYTIPGPALWDRASSGGSGSSKPSGGASSSAVAPSSPVSSAAAPSSPATSYGSSPSGPVSSVPPVPLPSGTAVPSGHIGTGASTGYVSYPTEGAPYPSASSASYAAPATTSAPGDLLASSLDVPIGAVTESAPAASSAPAATSSAPAPQPTDSYGSDDGEDDNGDSSSEPLSYGGSASGYGGEPLPEGVSFKDFLGWVNYYLKKGFNADGVHARDVVIRDRLGQCE